MQQYSTYKPSGIEWLGDIPSHWRKDKIARIVEFTASGGTPSSTNETFYGGDILWVQTGELNDCEIYDTVKKLSITGFKNSSTKIFPKETLLIAMYGATIGKLGILKVDASTNQACCALFLNDKKFNTRFFFYHFLNIREKLILSSYGGGQPNISQDVIKQETLFLPPIHEQSAIATYLDNTTSNIDTVIATKLEQLYQLELYKKSTIHKAVTKGINNKNKLKSSGIEWIGEIPYKWKIERLKDICINITSGGTPKTNNDDFWDDGTIIWLSPTDFQDFEDSVYIDNSRYKITSEGLNDCSASILPIGTVIMQSRASIGAVKISSKELCTNQGFINFIPGKLLNNKYLFYLINVFLGDYFQNIASGTTFMEISRSKAKQEKIPLPTLIEQTEIVSYLDNFCKSISSEKNIIEQQIATLKQYRKSLIHDCVTGKRKVI